MISPGLWVPLVCLQLTPLCVPAEPDPTGPASLTVASSLAPAPPMPGSVGADQGDLSAALRSLVLPGWGQRVQGRGHWWAFPVLELGAVAGAVDGHVGGARLRDRYRDLAWTAARAPLLDPTDAREDGPWEYYERMARWTTSGRFNLSSDPSRLVPEEDPSTYNGTIWVLARQLYLPDSEAEPDPSAPGFEQALDYYRQRAVPETMRWNWSTSPEALEPFRRMIDRSDDRFRRTSQFIGVIFLNHFISATDAWLGARSGTLQSLPITLDANAFPMNHRGDWTLWVRISPRNPRSMH